MKGEAGTILCVKYWHMHESDIFPRLIVNFEVDDNLVVSFSEGRGRYGMLMMALRKGFVNCCSAALKLCRTHLVDM
jgi:hypothetical protein